MEGRSLSRRALVATAATVVAGTTAGCLGGGDDDPTDTDETTVDTPDGRPPTAVFGFSYDPGGHLRVVHEGGDSIRADELYVRGEGFAANDGAEQTEAGPWAGATSGNVDGTPAVVSGDSVTVGVEATYDLRVVWVDADAEADAVLASDSGPDA